MDTTVTPTWASGPSIRRLVAVLLAILPLLVMASPARAEVMNPIERATAMGRPGLVYLETWYHAWLTDGRGYEFNDGRPFVVGSRCSGFAVSSDGYIVTAGHCVDPAMIHERVVALGVEEGLDRGFWDQRGAQGAYDYGLGNWVVRGGTGGSQPERSVTVQFGVAVAGLDGEQSTAARVVEVIGFAEGDVALIRIEATNLPTVALGRTDVTVGTQVLSIGYPGSADQVADASLEPTVRDGHVAAKRTRDGGKYPVWEISAAISGGMSGGPTIDQDGNVIGVNSFRHRVENDAYVAPVSLVHELLARNGVDTTPGALDVAYRAGVDALTNGDADTAIAQFDEVLALRPSHQQAQELRARAVELRASAVPESAGTGEGGSTDTDDGESTGGEESGEPLEPVIEPVASSGLPVFALLGVALLIGMVVVGTVVVLVLVRSQQQARSRASELDTLTRELERLRAAAPAADAHDDRQLVG